MHNFLPNLLIFAILTQIFTANCCIKHERDALLEFKGSVHDHGNRLASWRSKECCSWEGITCSNKTGHIIKFNLQSCIYPWNNSSLRGKINPTLLLLSNLEHLDLGCNYFSGNFPPNFMSSYRNLKYLNLQDNFGLSGTIPLELGNLSRLEYLNLRWTEFGGIIPPQLGNLSRLEYLDLGSSGFFVSNVWSLTQLTSLKYLDMEGVFFQDSKQWVQALNMLPLLQTLILGDNFLTSIPASIPVLNFSSLQSFIISGNTFNTTIPDWIWKLTKLTELDLSYCSFTGHVPSQLGDLNLLTMLHLGGNNLEGPIPPLHNLRNLTTLGISDLNIGEDIKYFMSRKLAKETWGKLEELSLHNTNLVGNLAGWIIKMSNISNLDLSSNNLNGTIPDEIGNLTNLEFLHLENNSFHGVVTEVQLIGLSNLVELSLGPNIAIRVGSNWVPTFQLVFLSLVGCKLGPHFPSWLQNQSQLLNIDLSNTGIVDHVPNWFWNLTSLYSVDLSQNQLGDRLPLSLEHLTNLNTINLKNNNFEGGIPSLPRFLASIDLSRNLLSGPIPTFIGSQLLSYLDLSNNYFTGTIEELTCVLNQLFFLNLERNNLFGKLPRCWHYTLDVVVLSHNKFSGSIPSSICTSNNLKILKLNNNSLSGKIPSTLLLCRNLYILDLGENNLHGQVPKWNAPDLDNLIILRLRSNRFTGVIPNSLFYLENLQVLDIAYNNIAGIIPQNMKLLLAMVSPGDPTNSNIDSLRSNLQYYDVSISLTMKGLNLEYTTTLLLLASIDLSRNNFTGIIPSTITSLHGLKNLNLSNNQLTGSIPLDVGGMKSLESLDLHNNELSGIIPQSISNLNFLATLNLSYNNLSGKVPSGNQLQTLNDPYNYVGNVYLCGPPLNEGCNPSTDVSIWNASKSNVDLDKVLLHLFIVLGFGFGFWIFFGMLLLKRNWRYQLFQMVDGRLENLCIVLVSLFERVKFVMAEI